MDKLQKQILDDATRKAEEIMGVAQKQADAVLKEAKGRSDAEEKSAREALEAESARLQEEQRENAELQERSMELEARHKLLDSLMPKLKSEVIRKVRASGYGKLINKAIAESNSVLPQEELILVIGKKDAGLVKNFGGKIQYGDVGNGVELRNKNGSVKISVTIEGLFEQKKSEIETMLIGELFSHREQEKPAPAKKAKPKKARKGKR